MTFTQTDCGEFGPIRLSQVLAKFIWRSFYSIVYKVTFLNNDVFDVFVLVDGDWIGK